MATKCVHQIVEPAAIAARLSHRRALGAAIAQHAGEENDRGPGPGHAYRAGKRDGEEFVLEPYARGN